MSIRYSMLFSMDVDCRTLNCADRQAIRFMFGLAPDGPPAIWPQTPCFQEAHVPPFLDVNNKDPWPLEYGAIVELRHGDAEDCRAYRLILQRQGVDLPDLMQALLFFQWLAPHAEEEGPIGLSFRSGVRDWPPDVFSVHSGALWYSPAGEAPKKF